LDVVVPARHAYSHCAPAFGEQAGTEEQALSAEHPGHENKKGARSGVRLEARAGGKVKAPGGDSMKNVTIRNRTNWARRKIHYFKQFVALNSSPEKSVCPLKNQSGLIPWSRQPSWSVFASWMTPTASSPNPVTMADIAENGDAGIYRCFCRWSGASFRPMNALRPASGEERIRPRFLLA
jgi:hypothetical protein